MRSWEVPKECLEFLMINRIRRGLVTVIRHIVIPVGYMIEIVAF